MQMGVRWAVGSPPHRSVPLALHTAIAEAEDEADGGSSLSSWTLTWLEGLPRLALDGELCLTLDSHGAPLRVRGGSGHHGETHEQEEDDDWLS